MVDDERVDEAPVDQDEPTNVQAPEGSSDEAAAQPEEVDYTSETFDPAALDDALRPAYNQMSKQFKGTYTQKFQELAEQRKETEAVQAAYQDLHSDDPEAQQRAAAFFGIELSQPDVQEEDDDEYEDPYEARIQALEQAHKQQAQESQQAQQHAAMEQHINSSFVTLIKDTGVDLDADEMVAIENQARATNPGQPDIRGAYEFLYSTVLPKRQQRYAKSKQAHQPGQGRSGSPAVDRSTPEARVAAIAKDLEAGMAGESG